MICIVWKFPYWTTAKIRFWIGYSILARREHGWAKGSLRFWKNQGHRAGHLAQLLEGVFIRNAICKLLCAAGPRYYGRTPKISIYLLGWQSRHTNSHHCLRRPHRPSRPRNHIHILVYPQHARLLILHQHMRRGRGRRQRRIRSRPIVAVIVVAITIPPKQRSTRPVPEHASPAGRAGRVPMVHPALPPLLVLLGNLRGPAALPGLLLLALPGAAPDAVAQGGPGQVTRCEEPVHAEFHVQPAEDVAGHAAGGAEGGVVRDGDHGEGEGN